MRQVRVIRVVFVISALRPFVLQERR